MRKAVSLRECILERMSMNRSQSDIYVFFYQGQGQMNNMKILPEAGYIIDSGRGQHYH